MTINQHLRTQRIHREIVAAIQEGFQDNPPPAISTGVQTTTMMTAYGNMVVRGRKIEYPKQMPVQLVAMIDLDHRSILVKWDHHE